MRYTRYNYKKNRDNILIMFILKLLGTVVGAGLCCIVLAYVAFNVLSENNAIPSGSLGNNTSVEANGSDIVSSQESVNKQVTNTSIFYSVQCGYFSNESNANQILNSISSKHGAFIYEDEGKYRVLSGIYESDNVDTVVEELQSSNIECAKIKYTFNNDDKVQYQIASICDGYLRLLNTVFSEDVKSINTDDFKSWTNELENLSEGENLEILSSLKEHVKNLASDIAKENVSSEMEYIYTILLNFKNI